MASTDEKLIRMVNQIASFFVTQPGDIATAKTSQHLHEFWDPSMIRQLGSLLDRTTEGLEPVALAAAQQVTQRTPA